MLLALAIFGGFYLFASNFYYTGKPQYLELIRERGRLIVATRNGPTTYYQANHGPAGLEYDLAHGFAHKLGVELEIVLADSIDELHRLLLQDEVDIVASGLPISVTSEALVRYSPVYQRVREQVVDRHNALPPPYSIEDLNAPLSTLANANHLETLSALRQTHPQLEWRVEHGLDFEELVKKVVDKKIRYALVNSNEVQAIHHYYPELRIAFDLTGEKGIAWAVKKSGDLSLLVQIQHYFHSLEVNGHLAHFLERYYGHVSTFDYLEIQVFMRRIQLRLTKYQKLFKEAGARYLVDWRLLAAMSYQESQWDSRAISPTGVRGLMMLTLNTASQLGVDNRLDPQQSIMGGAKYLAQLRRRLPESIREPDRTWMALAAYNVGYGHLLDAREITVLLDEEPDKWINVKKNLLLLRERKWHKKVKYGYARGGEPVHYVQNIRLYYDILTHLYQKNTREHL